MKRVLKIAALGISLGMLLLIIQEALQIDEDTFMRYYWTIAVACLVGAVLLNILYNLSYQRKMKRIAALLDAGKPEEFIAGVENLLRTAKGQALKNILTLNLAAGYMDAKQYHTAVDLLEDLTGKRLSGSTAKMVLRLNLCMGYFYTAQYEKALKLYHESQENFAKYRSNQNFGGNIAIADILAAVQNEQYERAEQLLDTAQKSWNDPRLQEGFQELRNLIVDRKAGALK